MKLVSDILAEIDAPVIESFTLKAREARCSAIPEVLRGSRVGHELGTEFKEFGGLWSHQAIALDHAGQGANTVLSTGTASGKSLVFRAATFHRLESEPDLRVLVFYPLKALAADQLLSWRHHAAALGNPDHLVGRIDGTIAMRERNGILDRARIVLMTPDVCHAWLMSSLAETPVRQFLANVDLVILDEAHTLEGVFGSNFAFLFRRLKLARDLLRRTTSRRVPMQVIAATATIVEPASHLRSLTGLSFESVEADEDGSPQWKRHCVHASPPEGGEQQAIAHMHECLVSELASGSFITFVDSRKGVEALAVATHQQLKNQQGLENVLPYRSGYEPEDRADIERRLKTGQLKGVITTSALELGIDIPHLVVGINQGVPSTRKAYRQRLGRIGRAAPGAFVLLADAGAFRTFGSTFEEYHAASVEPSHLYLDNRYMQFAHARCLVDEMEALGTTASRALASYRDWPEGFGDVLEAARPGSRRPREFDAIASLGGDSPQRSYPLRNVGELNLKLDRGGSGEGFGDLTLAQAIREAYPGAVYYHMARPYKVRSWRTSAFQASISVREDRRAFHTRPRIQTWANAGVTRGATLDNHLLVAGPNFLAECEMDITERVEGFYDAGNQYHAYRDLREKNPAMKSRSRHFRTTGMLASIDNVWFRETRNKQFVARALTDVFCREYSVLPQDVGWSATNISVATHEGTTRTGNCLVIYDQTYGSLRLTERLFTRFPQLLDRLERASLEVNATERDEWTHAALLLREFYDSLRAQVEEEIEVVRENEEFMQVFSPGSIVGYRQKGPLCTEVEIVAPAFQRTGAFGYRVKCKPKFDGPPATQWISADYLEAMGDDAEWSYCYWSPDTDEYVDGDPGDEASPVE